MKIIYARMQGYDWVSTPSDAVARELEKLGHTVSICENFDACPTDKYDFVWSPYESVTILGDYISERLDIPHFAHIEIIPPWRYFEDTDIENHGLDKTDPELTPQARHQNKQYYQTIINAYKKAAIRTTSNPCRMDYMKNAFGKMGDIHLRYPSIDVATLNKAQQMYSPQKLTNNILTLTRMVPIKRLDILVNIMNKVKTKCTWTILGEGALAGKIINTLDNKNVTLQLNKSVWGWGKTYEMMKANLFLFSTGAMPPMESALLGTPAIIMESQGSKYLPDFKDFQKLNYGDSLPIFEYEDYDTAAKMVNEQLAKPTILEEYDTVNKFMAGKTGITPSSVNAANIIKLMESV